MEGKERQEIKGAKTKSEKVRGNIKRGAYT